MSRYIDADALKKEVDNFPNCYNGWSDTYDKAFIIGAIEEQPSIDIVFCKECTERDDDWCMYFGKMINPDDFCSYGQKGDENVETD